MKTLLAIGMMLIAAFIWAGESPTSPPHAVTVVKGQVLEVKDVESYTYLRLKTDDGETWAAVGKAPVKIGDKVTIENAMVMKNFESKAQKKIYSTIIFGTLGGTGSILGAGNATAAAHGSVAKAVDTADIHVPKANGTNAQTVEDVNTKSAALKDQFVLVSGKVVKFSANIMGKNWIHLRDGTGSGAANSNDILVTTSSQTAIGNVVTVKGIVRTDKDFGSGYSYKVLIEEATLQP
jgi:hypothetical protein